MTLLAAEAPGCFAVGYSIGWAVIQARLASTTRLLGIRFRVQAGHPDGAAGLKPLGEFYSRQAMFAALPAAHLAAWLTLFPSRLEGHTTSIVFLLLLPAFVLIGIAALVWPLWACHREMLRQKRSLEPQADAVARRIDRTRTELREAADPARVRELTERITLDQRLFEEMERLPTWPISKQARARFALRNLLLLALPVLGQLLGGTSRLFEVVRAFFHAGA